MCNKDKHVKSKENTSLIKNIGYNMISQIVALIVPLITAPYIARVFNAELIGKYSYAVANSSYFVLLECLGFTLYGQIKIASFRDDKEKVSSFFLEIMFLKLSLMIVSIAIYIFTIVINADNSQKMLCAIMILNIIASGIDVTWFLNGMEEFRVIAIRSIFVRILNLVGVFTFVKNEHDFLTYALIMQAASLVANMSVYPNVLKQIDIKIPRSLNIFQHVKPACVYFVPGLINTIFSSSDKTMLGIWTGDYEVGIYEQASKISQICMSAVCTIGNVILPRASYLYHNDNKGEKVNKLIYDSLKAVQLVSAPAMFGIIAISGEFIPVFFGGGYEKSALVLSVLAFNVLITALCNLLGQQCLIARERQKDYNLTIIISALMNVTLNVAAIRVARSIGAAVASVLASVVCFIAILYKSRNTISIKEMFFQSWKYYVASIVMYVFLLQAKQIYYGTIEGIFIHIVIGIIIYLLGLSLLREKLVCKLRNSIMGRLLRND